MSIYPLYIVHTISRLLSTAQGSLLDDEVLVNTLQSSKRTSEDVSEQLQVAEQTEAKIDAAREVRFRVHLVYVIAIIEPQFFWCILDIIVCKFSVPGKLYMCIPC